MLRLERQWQDAGLPKLGTEAGDWFHTQITATETAYVIATGIYNNMPDPDGGIAAGLSRTRQQKTRSCVRSRLKRSRVIGLPFRTRGSMKATKRLAPTHIHNGSLLDTLARNLAGCYGRQNSPRANASITTGDNGLKSPSTTALSGGLIIHAQSSSWLT